MTDEERQRTMDFILRHQAQFAAGMQKLEEQQAQSNARHELADKQIAQLRGVLAMMARQFRRDRKDLRERIAALINAQIMTEEVTRQHGEAISRNNEAISQNNEAIRQNNEALRHTNEIARQNNEAIRALTAATGRDRENIAALAEAVDKMFRARGGNGGAA